MPTGISLSASKQEADIARRAEEVGIFVLQRVDAVDWSLFWILWLLELSPVLDIEAECSWFLKESALITVTHTKPMLHMLVCW